MACSGRLFSGPSSRLWGNPTPPLQSWDAAMFSPEGSDSQPDWQVDKQTENSTKDRKNYSRLCQGKIVQSFILQVSPLELKHERERFLSFTKVYGPTLRCILLLLQKSSVVTYVLLTIKYTMTNLCSKPISASFHIPPKHQQALHPQISVRHYRDQREASLTFELTG